MAIGDGFRAARALQRPSVGAVVVVWVPLVATVARATSLSVQDVGVGMDGLRGATQYSGGAGAALAPMATPTATADDKPAVIAVSRDGQYSSAAYLNPDGSDGVSQL